jgi:hypothetical protein
MSAGSIASFEIASLNSPTVTIADTSSSLTPSDADDLVIGVIAQ